MAQILFGIDKVRFMDIGRINGTTGVLDTIAGSVDLGKTVGGVTINQAEETIEIMSDQSADPEVIVPIRLGKDFTIRLRDCNPQNLALAFGGTVVGTNIVVFPATMPSATEKAVEITTKGGAGLVKKKVIIARAKLNLNGTLEFNVSDGSMLEITGQVLAPSSGTKSWSIIAG